MTMCQFAAILAADIVACLATADYPITPSDLVGFPRE